MNYLKCFRCCRIWLSPEFRSFRGIEKNQTIKGGVAGVLRGSMTSAGVLKNLRTNFGNRIQNPSNGLKLKVDARRRADCLALVAPNPPQEVLVRGHAGRVINKLSGTRHGAARPAGGGVTGAGDYRGTSPARKRPPP